MCLVAEDTGRYRKALEATGGIFGGIEPVHRFYEAFQGPIDAKHAAASVGLERDAFLKAIREKSNLQNLGLTPLVSGGQHKKGCLDGSIQRSDPWRSTRRIPRSLRSSIRIRFVRHRVGRFTFPMRIYVR